MKKTTITLFVFAMIAMSCSDKAGEETQVVTIPPPFNELIFGVVLDLPSVNAQYYFNLKSYSVKGKVNGKNDNYYHYYVANNGSEFLPHGSEITVKTTDGIMKLKATGTMTRTGNLQQDLNNELWTENSTYTIEIEANVNEDKINSATLTLNSDKFNATYDFGKIMRFYKTNGNLNAPEWNINNNKEFYVTDVSGKHTLNFTCNFAFNDVWGTNVKK